MRVASNSRQTADMEIVPDEVYASCVFVADASQIHIHIC